MNQRIKMELIPIKEQLADNIIFTDNPDYRDAIYQTVDFYKRVGYNIPWIGYCEQSDGVLKGCAAFKGKPLNGKVEIAYGVFPQYYGQGIGTKIAAVLIDLALKTDPSVTITAKTLPEENYSVKILRKNKFKFLGIVMNEEDGEVWEWEYQK